MLYESAVYSAIHHTIAASRIYEKLLKLDNVHVSRDPRRNVLGSVVFISNQNKSVISGTGKLFTNFLQNRNVSGYSGQGEVIKFEHDDNYEEASLQVINFEQTFGHLRADLRSGKLNFVIYVFNLVLFLINEWYQKCTVHTYRWIIWLCCEAKIRRKTVNFKLS